MAKMTFAKAVKYKGTLHLGNTTILVADEDVEALKQSGGWVLEEPVVETPVEIEVREVPEDIEEVSEPAPVKAKTKTAKPKAE